MPTQTVEEHPELLLRKQCDGKHGLTPLFVFDVRDVISAEGVRVITIIKTRNDGLNMIEQPCIGDGAEDRLAQIPAGGWQRMMGYVVNNIETMNNLVQIVISLSLAERPDGEEVGTQVNFARCHPRQLTRR